jgi:hypothetical protein
MTDEVDKSSEELPVFKVVDGALVRKSDDSRDSNKRYAQVAGPEGSYLREFTDEEERQRDEEEARWAADAPKRALEAERRKTQGEAFRDSLKYEIGLVAFVDILGWSDAVRTAPKDPEQTKKLGLALSMIRGLTQLAAWKVKNSGDDGWPGDQQVTHFSDCLIISARTDYAGKSAIISALGFLSMALLYRGFLL